MRTYGRLGMVKYSLSRPEDDDEVRRFDLKYLGFPNGGNRLEDEMRAERRAIRGAKKPPDWAN
jgi:hypothetical protein